MNARAETTPAFRALCAGIFAASFGVVLLEIALGRIFSFTIWYHFSYLTISVALLGFAAAGSLLAAFPRLLDDVSALLRQASLTAALGVAILLFVASGVSLDPVAVLHEKQQLTNLAGYYLALMMPFLGAGMAIVGAIAVAPTRIARLYFWDLAGAALACLAVVPLIWRFGTPVTVALSATAFCAAAVAFSRPTTPSRVALAIVLATVTIAVGATVEFVPGSKKFLSIHSATGARPIFQRWTPINRVDVVAWDETTQDDRLGYRGWGASPRYDGPGQHFRMIGYDGDSCASMYRWSGAREELDWLHHHVFEAPYLLTERPRVLVIGVGGGVDILTAIANDAASIVGVELNPITIALEQGPYAAYNGGILNRPEVTMVAAEGRHFLRSTADRYDLIEMNSIGTLSASSSAAYVLPESYLFTADAVSDYLSHLTPGGVFASATGDFNTPEWQPRHTLRLLSNVRRALARRGVQAPERHVAIVASAEGLAMVHTLVKAEPFTAEDMARLDAFVQTEGFEYWQRPDRRVDHAAALLLWGDDAEREAFYARQDLNLRATTDESPFFFNFYKWRTLWKRSGEMDAARTFTTGQIVLVLMLAQSVVAAAVLVLAPLIARRGADLGSMPRRSGYVLYFVAVGLGFMLLEISFLQRFGLYLGYPTYTISVVLFSLLIFAGLGSLLSARIAPPYERALTAALAALVSLTMLYLLGLSVIFGATLGASLPVRIAIAVALLAPLGLLLGVFFPLGITLVSARSVHFVPWAWAITGCAGVVGTILAVMLAISWDFRVVTLLALAIYAAGVGALAWAEKARPAAVV
jgi:spermidine synthase